MTTKRFARIPVTDLARIALLPRVLKKTELKKFGLFVPRKSYFIVRRLLPWLYALDLPLFSVPQESWDRIELEIRARAKPDFVDSCVEVADLIWRLNLSRGTVAAKFSGPPFFVGPNHPVQFPIAHVCRVSDRLLFPFVQMRRAHGLDIKGLGVLASMIRAAYVFGDYEKAGVEVIDLSIPKHMKGRQVRVFYGEDLPSYSLDDLNDMVFEVFEVIAEIEKEDEP